MFRKTFKSSLIRLGCPSTEWENQWSAHGKKKKTIPTPHQITGLPHSAKFLIEILKARFLWSKQNSCEDNRDSWWLLCEMPQQQRPESRKTSACMHERACARIYIYRKWKLGYIWFFKLVLKTRCHRELGDCDQPSGQCILYGTKGQRHRPRSPCLALADIATWSWKTCFWLT